MLISFTKHHKHPKLLPDIVLTPLRASPWKLQTTWILLFLQTLCIYYKRILTNKHFFGKT